MSSFGIQTTKALSDEWARITAGGLLCESAYGLTESHTQATIMPPEHVVWGSNGSCPFEEMKVKIVEDGEEVPVGGVGEIWVKNKGVFKGYLHNPEATKEVLTEDGWLRTGDAGKMDEEGFLYFLGRRKEMIKSLGYSVFPEEVEMYLSMHEAVDKSCIISKEIDGRECIKAFVVLRPEFAGKVTEEDLIKWSKESMSTYKRPREIEFVDAVPTTPSGKLMRRKMSDYEAEKTRPA
jgi:long-chain acyl-CoA synthetase